MPKYILNVAENWYRRYIVEAPSEDKVIDIYRQWAKTDVGIVEELDSPAFIDDGPIDSFFVEGPYDTSE